MGKKSIKGEFPGNNPNIYPYYVHVDIHYTNVAIVVITLLLVFLGYYKMARLAELNIPWDFYLAVRLAPPLDSSQKNYRFAH